MDDPSSTPTEGDRVFELVDSTRRYLLTREEDGFAVWDTEGGVDVPVEAFPLTDDGEQDARDRFQTLRSEDRRERIVPSVLFWVAILGGIAWVSARVVLGLGYLTTVRPFKGSGEWLVWAQGAETITFAVFIGASVLYVVLWISRRAPS
jgi:hypothetical protein